ncbi:MAG TPA: hypothetical protein VKF38_04945 [Anaerolineaceae bacterium]|nr:hypothetical protein [Anaerolineaceae bacterium]
MSEDPDITKNQAGSPPSSSSDNQTGQISAETSIPDQKTFSDQSAVQGNIEPPELLKDISTIEPDNKAPTQDQTKPDLLNKLPQQPPVSPGEHTSMGGHTGVTNWLSQRRAQSKGTPAMGGHTGVTGWLRHLQAKTKSTSASETSSSQEAGTSDWVHGQRTQPDLTASSEIEPSQNVTPGQPNQKPVAIPAEETSDLLKNLAPSPAETTTPEIQTSGVSALKMSKLEESDTGEALFSDFRQSLVEEEKTDRAERTRKLKMPGFIRRLNSALTRKTGNSDESLISPTDDATTAAETLPAEYLSDIDKSSNPIEVEFEMPQWAISDEQGNSQKNVSESLAAIIDSGKTAELSSRDLDKLREEPDAHSLSALAGNNLEAPVTGGREPLEDDYSLAENQVIKTESEQAFVENKPPQEEDAGTETVSIVGAGHAVQAQNLTPEESLLGGLEPAPFESGQFSKPSEQVSVEDQAEQKASKPGQSQSLWRRVTNILKRPAKSGGDQQAEGIPERQILDRLNTALPDSLTISVPELDQIQPQAGIEVQTNKPNIIPEVPAVETRLTEIPTTPVPDQISETQAAEEEDQTIWSAYEDTPSNDQVRSAEPSPFIDGSLTQLTLGVEPVEPATQTPAFNSDEPDISASEINAAIDQSQEAISPFLTKDSPWLGELRDAIDTDDDLSTPSSAPEVETPPEKSDIWERLLVEEERSEQALQTKQAAENTIPKKASAFLEIPGEESVSEVPENIQAPEYNLGPTLDQTPSGLETALISDQEVDDLLGPFRSQNEQDESGGWIEEKTRPQSDRAGLPEPSSEAIQDLNESTRLYDSIFEDQKQQAMRSMLLGEEAEQEGTSTIGPMPDFTEEGMEKSKSWWARRTRLQIGMIILAGLVLVALVGIGAVYVMHRISPQVATPQPVVSVQQSEPNGIYPIGIELTGGWIFSLNSSTLVQGLWVPKSAEWLNGTQVRRVVALPWSRQTEAVIRSFQLGDEIRLFFSNKQTFLYKVSEIKQVPVGDVSVLSDTQPSLAVILYQTGSNQRWVVIAAQEP